MLGEAVLTPDIKYKLGWIIVPGLGPMPLPNALWTDEYKRFNAPLTFWLNCGLICIPFYCPAVATVHMGSLTPPPAILGQSPLPPSPPPSPAALYHFFPPNSSLPRPHLSGANDPTDLSGVLFSNLPVRGRRAVLVSLRQASVSSPCPVQENSPQAILPNQAFRGRYNPMAFTTG